MKICLYIKSGLLILTILISQSIHSQNTDWNNDLKLYATQLEKLHIDLYNKISKEDFQNTLNDIRDISETENDFNVIIALMKLTRQIGDGHTSVSLRNLETHRFPFKVKWIDNKWRVVKVLESHKVLLKMTLTKINNVPIAEVTSKINEVVQFVENEHSEVVRVGDNLTLSELLYHLNITTDIDKSTFTFVDENQREHEVMLLASDASIIDTKAFVELNIGVPEIIKPDHTMFNYLWFAPIKKTKAVYIKFDSYPSFEDMQVFVQNLLQYIETNAFENIVIDMRENGGGDLYVGVVLAHALNLADSISWNDGVYVMCSNVTFSAGTSNVALFRQLLNAKIIGQPTGSNPTGYQDMDQFELPNSKLIVTYSKRKFRLSEKNVQGVQPDLMINYNWNDYKNNKDTMLDRVIENLKRE